MKHRTSNIERRTSNVSDFVQLGVRCSMFDVRCLLNRRGCAGVGRLSPRRPMSLPQLVVVNAYGADCPSCVSYCVALCRIMRIALERGQLVHRSLGGGEPCTHKAPNTNIQALENFQKPITKRISCQRAHQSWCLGIGASMELGCGRLVLRVFTRHFDAFLFHIRSNCRRRFSLFHLVSPRFSYKGKKIGTRRLKSYVFSYGDSDARQVGSVSTLQRAVCGHAKAWTPYTLAHRALLKKERTGLSALPCCPERSTYANALRDFHAFCYRVLRLVAPGCSLLQLTEKNCLQTSPARMAPERGQPCPRRFRHRKCRETDARQFFADCQCPTKNWVQAPPAACLTGLGRVVSFCTPER